MLNITTKELEIENDLYNENILNNDDIDIIQNNKNKENKIER